MKFEPVKLRVVEIALGSATQYGARQQCLAPQRNQALRVEITRVHRPKPHKQGAPGSAR